MAYTLDTSSTGYRSGVVGGPPPANSPTTFSVSSADSSDFVASDVGRIIRILDGPAAGQIRWITSFVNASQVMIDSPWNVEPFRAFNAGNGSQIPANNPTYTQVLGTPTTGSSYQLAFTMAELQALAPADITVVDINQTQGSLQNPGNDAIYSFGNTAANNITFNGVTLQCEDLTIMANIRARWRSTLASNSALVFGRLNAGDTSNDDGVPYAHHGVTIIDTSTSAFGEGEFVPDLHVYGSKYSSPSFSIGSTGDENNVPFNFFRFNGNDDIIVRFFDNNVTGNFGGRFQGTKSVFLNNTVSTSRTVGGFFNPVSTDGSFFGINEGNRFFDCDQAIYHWFNQGGDGQSNVQAISDIRSRVARLLGDRDGNTFTFRNFPIADYNALPQIEVGGVMVDVPIVVNESSGSGADNSWRIIQDIDINIVDENGAAITEDATLFHRNSRDVDVTETPITTGTFERLELEYESKDISGSGSDALGSGTASHPYSAVIAVRGRVPQFVTLAAEAPGGVPERIQLVMIPDTSVTNTNVIDTIPATITDGDGLASAEGYSNAQATYKYMNPELPSVNSNLFTRSGNDIIFDDSPEFDVVVDFSATTPLSYNETSSVLTMGVPVGVDGVRGTSANLIPQLGRTLRFVGTAQDGAVIRGGFGALGNPTTVEFGFSTRQADGILIQTDEPLFGTIALPAGNFIIDRVNGATLDDLTITRASGSGNVNIIVRNASGSPTFNSAQVQVITSLDITIDGPAAGTGRIDLFEDGTFTRFAGEAGPIASFDTTDSNRISGGRDIIAVWSGPSHADVRVALTLNPGSNTLGVNPTVSQAPPFVPAEYSNVQDALVNYDTDIAGKIRC